MSPRYTFDMGNSTDGPIGFVARVTADSFDDAARLLNKALPEMIEVHSDEEGVDYINVYFNTEAVEADDAEEE